MEPKEPSEIERHLNDVQMIKGILVQHDERPLLESWGFLAWGVLIAAATAVHALFGSALEGVTRSVALLIWLPTIIVASALESVAWIQRVKKEQTPIFGRRFLRYLLNFLSVAIVVFAVMIVLYEHAALSPGILLCLLALFFTAYAQASFATLFFEGYFMLAVGIAFIAIGVEGPAAYVAAGAIAAAGCFSSGVHAEVLTRRARE